MNKLDKTFTLAIDGPAGAGKSTIAKMVAEKLKYTYIDTGAMYRAVTFAYLSSGNPFSEDLVGEIAETINISFQEKAGINHVFIDGRDVTNEIRNAEVTGNVSKISSIPMVRDALVNQQRRMGSEVNVVMDGRDIGTVVFPNADLKVFLTASVEERAQRRYKELVAKGEKVELAKLQEEISMRDKMDSERKVAPLKCAENAVFLDSSNMNIQEVVDYILKLVKEHK